MYYEFYMDVFFVVNLLLDFFVLSLTSQLLKGTASPVRAALGAAAGAAGACGLFLLPAEIFKAAVVMLHPVLTILMIKITCRVKSLRQLLQGVCCFYAASFLLGGALGALPMGIRRKIFQFLIITFTAYIAIHTGIRLCKYLKGREKCFCQATLWLGRKSKQVKGLYDTGNRLRDSRTGKPVCVMEYQAFEALLGERQRKALELFFRQSWGADKEEGEERKALQGLNPRFLI